MKGMLFTYFPERRLVAFQTGKNKNVVVFIGGLTDGLLAEDYIESLSERLMENSWSLIQVLLGSSYTGYGISSLEKDCKELDKLIEYLKNTGIDRIALLGHSTGCQDIVYYLKHGKNKKAVYKAILQGPVSDRDYMRTLPNYENYIALAEKMVKEGKEDELIPRDANHVPITAYRYHSLGGRLTDDDMFSDDLTPKELSKILGHIKILTLVVYSMQDEYIPKGVDKDRLAGRITLGIPKATLVKIDGNHSLEGLEQEFSDAVIKFLIKEK